MFNQNVFYQKVNCKYKIVVISYVLTALKIAVSVCFFSPDTWLLWTITSLNLENILTPLKCHDFSIPVWWAKDCFDFKTCVGVPVCLEPVISLFLVKDEKLICRKDWSCLSPCFFPVVTGATDGIGKSYAEEVRVSLLIYLFAPRKAQWLITRQRFHSEAKRRRVTRRLLVERPVTSHNLYS